jgi:predicted Zn-dependent protease
MRITICNFKRNRDSIDESGVAFLEDNDDVKFIVDAEGVRQSDVWSYNFSIEVSVIAESPTFSAK